LFALAAATAAALACGPSPDPKSGASATCSGEERPQLNCDSEFKYDGRKLEGGFSVAGIGGANAKTEEAAIRAIDKETEQYAAQSRRLCDEYNKCVVDKSTYATRSENLRRRMSKVPQLFDDVKSATDDDGRRKALGKAYVALVPDDARRELALDFSVEAQKPSESTPRPITPGEKLPTGTRVAFVLRSSKSAYVYLFQKGPDGKVNVLFPDTRIGTSNPVSAGAALRLPPAAGASFKLNDKDLGTERVYLVASLDPVVSLDGAIASAAHGGAPQGALQAVTTASSGPSPGCTRALELDEGPAPKCIRSRGLELDEGPAPSAGGAAKAVSFRARTEAADSVIVQVFGFEHTP
jgi:hypothetical protein